MTDAGSTDSCSISASSSSRFGGDGTIGSFDDGLDTAWMREHLGRAATEPRRGSDSGDSDLEDTPRNWAQLSDLSALPANGDAA